MILATFCCATYVRLRCCTNLNLSFILEIFVTLQVEHRQHPQRQLHGVGVIKLFSVVLCPIVKGAPLGQAVALLANIRLDSRGLTEISDLFYIIYQQKYPVLPGIKCKPVPCQLLLKGLLAQPTTPHTLLCCSCTWH